MRVCLVSQHYPPDTARGGIGTQTANKARALARLGHEVRVLSCAAGTRRITQTTEEGITVERIPGPGSEEGRDFPIYTEAAYWVAYSWSLLPELNRLIETFEPDVIDFPEYGAEGFAYLLDRTPDNWAPVVVQLHAPLAMLAEHIGWPEPDGDFYAVGTFAESFSIRHADALMACSAGIADFVAGRYGVSRASIDVVHCGVDTDVFRPAAEPANGRPPTALFVGNLAGNKGIETVLAAVLALRRKYPKLRLQVVGEGDEELLERLRRRAREQDAAESVEFHGFVEQPRLPAFYGGADVFCSPAQYEGGVANVYLEAMACGCPVVASTAGGAPEAVVHGETGLLVPPLDPGAVAEALDRILGDPSLRSRMGEAARRRAEEQFALGAYIERVLRVYERAIERSRSKREQLAAGNP